MRQGEIAVIAPDEDLYRLVERLRRGAWKDLEVVHAEMEEGVARARELLGRGTRVLVSRGGTRGLLQRFLEGVPVVNIPITEYEIVTMLSQAKRISTKIAVISFSTPFAKGAQDLAPALELEVHTYLVSTESAVGPMLSQALRDGAEVIVGAAQVHRQCERMGIPCVLLQTPEQVVTAALEEAGSVLAAIKREQVWGRRQSAILNAITSGIVAVDAEGGIIDYNRAAGQALGLAQGEVRFHRVFDPLLEQTARGEGPVQDALVTIADAQFLTSLIPVRLERETFGTIIRLDPVTRLREMEQRSRAKLTERGLRARYTFSDILTRDGRMEALKNRCGQYAATGLTVLIRGESGTGKELVAQSIHNASPRSRMPFVAINCGAFPENLLESELFGYVEGAFTGARKGGKLGCFELAHEGTLFLDEIGEISPSVQARLLRVLEEGQIIRLGDDRVTAVDVRVVCATNRDLYQMVEEGSFRGDLFYRINVLEVLLPPLRERKGDIPLLTERLLEQVSERLGIPSPALTPEAVALLMTHTWPGNVRELRNTVERLVVGFGGQTVSGGEVEEVMLSPARGAPVSGPGRMGDWEENAIRCTLELCGGNRAETARRLGVSKSTLWRKMKELGI